MNAAYEVSREALENAVKMFGDSPKTREIIQTVYNIGRIDGKIEATSNALSKIREVVAA
jgi:hypothetical protein